MWVQTADAATTGREEIGSSRPSSTSWALSTALIRQAQSATRAGRTSASTAPFGLRGASRDILATGPQTYTYDAEGNRTRATADGVTTTYTYDQANRLTGVDGAISYAYDGDGMRTDKTIGSTTRHLAWDDSSLLPLLLDDGAGSFVYGPSGEPVEQITGSSASFLLQDQQHSTRLLTDTAGSVLGTYTYDPWGVVISHTGTAETALQYDGEYTDAETGLQYLRARYYDARSGQFINTDPLVQLTRERYGYANDNPLTLSDGSGLLTIGRCLSGTLQLGIGFTGSACLQFSSTGDIGATFTGGPLVGGGADLELGPGVEVSNADHISQLSGPFVGVGAGAADVVGGYGEAFGGFDDCDNLIYGGLIGVAGGAGIEGHGDVTYTVPISVNIPSLFGRASSALSGALGWL